MLRFCLISLFFNPVFERIPMTIRKTWLAASVSAALFSLAAQAADENATAPAESSAQTQTLQNVTVSAVNRSTRTENKDTYTTSAMKTTTGLALSPKETPQSVSVITKTQLSDRGISSLKDAMKTTTGVNVLRESGRYRFQSRGFYVDQIEEDGIATTVAGSSGNPYRDAQSLYDMAIYDHVEVVRGATGLTQVNGEPGGTVNAVRKKPTAQTQIQGDLLVNRFGKARATLDVSGSLNESKTLRGRTVVVGERSRGYKDNDKGDLGLFYGVLEGHIGENTKVTAGLLHQRHTETPDYFGVPMSVSGGDAGFNTDTYLGYDWTHAKFRKTNAFAELEHYFNDDWTATAKFNYIHSKSDSRLGAIYDASTTYKGLPAGGKLNTQNFQNYQNNGHQATVQLNLNGKYDLFGRKHDVFLGYTYSRENNDTTWRRIRNSRAYDPRTFTGGEQAEPNWANYNDRTFYHNRITSNSLMLGTRVNVLDNLHVIAGTRYTQWKADGVTDYDWWNNRPDTDKDEHSIRRKNRFVPYFGITYDITPSQSVYASYTSIFKPNNAKDINERYLKPVVGNNYEIGWKGEWFNRKLNTSVALFQIDQKNRSVQVYFPTLNKWYNENVGHVRSRGLDLEISGNLTENWKIFAGYTLNNSKYMRGENGRNSVSPYLQGANFSRHTPKHIFRLHTSYDLPWGGRKWTVGGGVSAQSKTSSLGYVKQGGYALWHANVKYAPSENLQFSLIADNLFNKRYFENNKVRYNGINNYLGEPRNISLKVDWKFK